MPIHIGNSDIKEIYYSSSKIKQVYYGSQLVFNEPTLEYVDLGLPSGTMWMKYNIGASKETDCGLFFQWGDTVGYSSDEAMAHSYWSTCPGNGGASSADDSALATWNAANLTYDMLNADVDAAYVHTNGEAKMPTEGQIQELTANTTSEWTTIDGVAGYKFTNKSDSSKYIFIPSYGIYDEGVYAVGGYYWTSSVSLSTAQGAQALYFYNNTPPGIWQSGRATARNVRGVLDR